MHISFNELRQIKHSLPTGSVARIADELNVSEQTVRNYFGAKKYGKQTQPLDVHRQPGPDGGIIELKDTNIYEAAMRLITPEQAANA